MSKIIVRRQEYANNGTHANEIEAVVKQNLIVNTLSSALDVAPSVGLLKTVNDSFEIETNYPITGVQLIKTGRVCTVIFTNVTVGSIRNLQFPNGFKPAGQGYYIFPYRDGTKYYYGLIQLTRNGIGTDFTYNPSVGNDRQYVPDTFQPFGNLVYICE